MEKQIMSKKYVYNMEATEWTVLKSLKPSSLDWNWKKKLAGPGPQFCISFQAGPGSGQNFYFPFNWAGLGPKFHFRPARNFFSLLRAMTGQYSSHGGQARSQKSGLCRLQIQMLQHIHMFLKKKTNYQCRKILRNWKDLKPFYEVKCIENSIRYIQDS